MRGFGRSGWTGGGGSAYRLALEPATANTVNRDPGIYLIGGSPLLIVEGELETPPVEP